MRRRGFTLVEMLVAMALTVFLMAILAEAFVTALETFRQLKGLGDMQQGVRIAFLKLQNDLRADHFDGNRKLSDPYFWGNPPAGSDGLPSLGPRRGFFRIVQGAPSILEGTDLDGLPSYRAFNHILHFSICLARGNHRENFLSATVPAGSPLLNPPLYPTDQGGDAHYQDQPQTYTSPWAEVAYFLVPQGTTTEPHNPAASSGTPLFSLYRTQKVVVPENVGINAQGIPAAQYSLYNEISCEPNPNNPNVLYFNSPADLARSTTYRAITYPSGAYTPGPGSAKLLENVVSFQVRILLAGAGDFQDVPGGVFDTAAPPSPLNIIGLQIALRVWDEATQQTLQMTLIQDM